MNVQILPFSGKPLDFDYEGGGNVRFPSSEHGFLLGKITKENYKTTEFAKAVK